MYWSYGNEVENDNHKGEVKAVSMLGLYDNTKESVKTDLQVSWDGPRVSFECSANDVVLLSCTDSYNMINDPNSTIIEFDGPAGLTQQRLIYGLPWWPESINSDNWSLKESDYSLNGHIHVSGQPRSRRLAPVVRNESKIIFSLEDVFPKEMNAELSSASGEIEYYKKPKMSLSCLLIMF